MNEVTKRFAILVAAVCFLFVAVLYRNHGRFQVLGVGDDWMAIDSHTGQTCVTTGPDHGITPCKDLAKSWK